MEHVTLTVCPLHNAWDAASWHEGMEQSCSCVTREELPHGVDGIEQLSSGVHTCRLHLGSGNACMAMFR